MSGITPVQGGPDRSTLSSTVRAAKDSPTDAATAAKHAAQVKKAKLLAAKKLKLAADAKREAKDAAAKAALASTGTSTTTVDVLA